MKNESIALIRDVAMMPNKNEICMQILLLFFFFEMEYEIHEEIYGAKCKNNDQKHCTSGTPLSIQWTATNKTKITANKSFAFIDVLNWFAICSIYIEK